jgi:hypothetical protein
MKINDQVASLEQDLIRSIEGYSGYQITKDRLKTDQRLRNYFTEKIKHIEQAFGKMSANKISNGSSTINETNNKVIKLLQELNETLHRPTYNNSSFFSKSSVDPETLTQLYQYESQFNERLNVLNDETKQLDQQPTTPTDSELFNYLFDVIDNLNQIIIQREFILAGGNSDEL